MASIESRKLGSGDTAWRVRFRHSGKNISRAFDAEAAAKQLKAAVELAGADTALALVDGTPSTPSRKVVYRTVAGQVAHYIEHRTGLTEGTRRKYTKIAAARIDESAIGRTLIHELTDDDVSRWYNRLTGAAKTKANIQGLLSTALQFAVDRNELDKNVAKGIRHDRAEAPGREPVFLTSDEVRLLLECLPEFWRPLPLFLVGTGVRFGEATALTVGHLDLAGNGAMIRQAWKDSSGGPPILGSPKTRKSVRTISIPPGLSDFLASHVAGKARTDWVFCNRRSNPIQNAAWHGRVWAPAMDKFEAQTGMRPRVHDLRHTYASWSIKTGMPLPVIQQQLGHESITTTVDTYGHLVRADFHALAVAVGANLPMIGN